MPIGVVIAEAPSGRVIFRNPGFVEIWGEAAPSPARLEEYDVWTGLRPGGGTYGPLDWPLARAARTGERIRDEEIEVVSADGSRCVYSVSAGPILDEEGTAYAAAATFIDVTARHAAEDAVRGSEERLRLAARSIPQVFALYDRIGSVPLRERGRDPARRAAPGRPDRPERPRGLRPPRRAGVLPPRP